LILLRHGSLESFRASVFSHPHVQQIEGLHECLKQRRVRVTITIYFKNLPPDHLLLDSAPNLGPLISRWDIKSSKIADTKVSGFQRF
jgi:hypothetical protein